MELRCGKITTHRKVYWSVRHQKKCLFDDIKQLVVNMESQKDNVHQQLVIVIALFKILCDNYTFISETFGVRFENVSFDRATYFSQEIEDLIKEEKITRDNLLYIQCTFYLKTYLKLHHKRHFDAQAK